jgi:hypothetical protein
MGIIDRIVFVTTSGYITERTWINQFPASESGFENFTISATSIHTA